MILEFWVGVVSGIGIMLIMLSVILWRVSKKVTKKER